MATIESNAAKKEDVSRETSEEKPVEVELPLETVEKTEEKPQEKSEEKPEKKDEELNEYSKNVQKRINQITDRYRKEQRDKEEAVRLAETLKSENENYPKIILDSKMETTIWGVATYVIHNLS